MAKSSLDKDLGKVVHLETATQAVARSLATPGLTMLFFVGALLVAVLSISEGPLSWFVIVAAIIAAYMALNVGANDVANNMGPAVGSRALTLTGALIIAAICEAAGALLAGGDVVNTVSRSLLRPDETMEALQFILIMMAAFLAAAMWIHLATIVGAPVSTTHSVVGGVIGAGVAASGFSVVAWPMIGAIVASWVISPGLGGLIAAALLGFVKWSIIYRDDRIAAARRWVPVLVGMMTGVFAMFLAMKGLSRIWRPEFSTVLLLGVIFFGLGWAVARPWVARRSIGLENRRKHVASLFTLPLIFAAALPKPAPSRRALSSCRSGCWRSALSVSRSGLPCSGRGSSGRSARRSPGWTRSAPSAWRFPPQRRCSSLPRWACPSPRPISPSVRSSASAFCARP